MRVRKIIMWLVGGFYILLGVANLLALIALPEIREQIISLGAVVFRYSAYVLAGIGMVLLRKWSAYVWCAGLVVNWLIFFTVYSGQSNSYPWYWSLIGPVLLVALYYYAWPVLRPSADLQPQEHRA